MFVGGLLSAVLLHWCSYVLGHFIQSVLPLTALEPGHEERRAGCLKPSEDI